MWQHLCDSIFSTWMRIPNGAYTNTNIIGGCWLINYLDGENVELMLANVCC
jgi:hypothetical protein